MRTNPFEGRGLYTKFVRACYSRLMRREWFSLADVMADHLGLKSAAEIIKISSPDYHYGELKKAFMDISKLLKERCGEDCIETDGNNRNKRFRYVGEAYDPLEDLKNAQAIKDIQTYAQFCIDSAGFFPTSWVEYFLEDTLDLLKITRRKKSGEQSIVSSVDRELRNIELLPLLYDAIRNKDVLSIGYQPAGKDIKVIEFHPHILKEYNGRWFLFGWAKNELPEMAHNLALDRIKEINSIKGVEYVVAPKNFYLDYFKDIIGVTHNRDKKPAEDIIIRARNFRMFNLIETKKLHPSQITTKTYGDYDGARYGEFQIHVEVNNEFIGRILQMGAGLEVISPSTVRDIFRQRSANIADLYKD